MKTIEAAAYLLLAVAVLSNPVPEVQTRNIFERRFLNKEFVVYSTNHTILNINVPVDATDFTISNDDDDDDDNKQTLLVFFNLADIHPNGTIERLGQYVLKGSNAHEVLKFGTDSASDFTNDTNVYFGAKDGLYIYKPETMSAVKYGPITDSIIQLRKAHGADLLYVLTEDHTLYKVTENGSIKTTVTDITCAQEFAIDAVHNLYYYCEDKVLHMKTLNGTIKKIDGLPGTISSAKLVDAPFVLDDSVAFIADGVLFKVFSNATSLDSNFDIQATLSSQSIHSGILVYVAMDGKMYQYNILELVIRKLLGQTSELLKEFKSTIQSLTNSVMNSLD